MADEVVAVAPTEQAPAAPSAPASNAPAEGSQDAAPKAESAPAAPPEGEKKPDTQDPAEKRGNSRYERRINRLHREAAEAKAERDLFRRQLEEARQTQPQAADPHAPRIEQYDDIEKYAAAKAKYESEKTLREHTAKQQQESAKQHQARISAEWEDRVERAAEKYEDWADVVGEIQPTSPFAVTLMRAENGEDVAYHLGKNLKEAQRIAGLDPLSQVFELGRLSAKLAAEPKKPPQSSKAPAPIDPLKGAAKADPNLPSENDDMKAWMKKRQGQVHGARPR